MKREMREIEDTDLRLLDLLQQDIPLVPKPWEDLGRAVGISSEEVLERLTRLKDAGILRGIAPTLESEKGGRKVSTLVAVRVPGENIDTVAARINQYDEVSHNFLRDHPYNLWFTLACSTESELKSLLDEIQKETGIKSEDMLNLSTLQKFKIHVTFPIMERGV